MRVLVACEFSGVVRDAFAAHGHDAWSCDIVPAKRNHFVKHIRADVLTVLDQGWDLMVAHPPCTYLTAAGNKWYRPEYTGRFPDRAARRERAVEFFIQLANAPIEAIAIENPVGIMSSRFRRPDQIIQPHQFGHPVRKTTCLWLKNLPPLVPTAHVEPELHTFPSGNTQSAWHTITGHIRDAAARARARSTTFDGIARAMADQWSTSLALKDSA